MKKITLLLGVATLLTTNCFSQDKGYIAFSLGSSTPIRDLASKDPNNSAASYAKSGAIVDFSFGYKLGKNFGVAALWRGQEYPFDGRAIERQLEEQNPGLNSYVDSKPWSIEGLMIGAYGSFPISKKVSFESRVLIGFLTSTSPEMTINLSGSGASSWIKQSSSSSSSFTYLLGVGFKYDIGRRTCLLANFDYLDAHPEFTDIELYSSTGSRSTNTFNQSLGAINIGLGIGYRL